jgi:Protein of unknown function (DUF3551)
MRRCYLAVAAMTVLASIATLPTAGQAQEYPFCIKGEFWPSFTGDCSFATYQQCLAEASGRAGAYCDANPFLGVRVNQAGVASNKRKKPSH